MANILSGEDFSLLAAERFNYLGAHVIANGSEYTYFIGNGSCLTGGDIMADTEHVVCCLSQKRGSKYRFT